MKRVNPLNLNGRIEDIQQDDEFGAFAIACVLIFAIVIIGLCILRYMIGGS